MGQTAKTPVIWTIHSGILYKLISEYLRIGWMMKIPCPFAGSILIFLIIFILVSFSVFLEIIGILLFLVSRIISLWLIICKSPARKFVPRDSKWSKWPNYIPTRFKLFYENSRLKLFSLFDQTLIQLRFRRLNHRRRLLNTLGKIFLSDSHS